MIRRVAGRDQRPHLPCSLEIARALEVAGGAVGRVLVCPFDVVAA